MNNHSPSWHCIQQCGACCRLCPEERGEALAALSEDQQSIYFSMVGADGWCIHYNSGARSCTIYSERPDFCRVSELGTLFDVPSDDLDPFAIACCKQQIRTTYGGRSGVMRRFNRAQRTEGDRHE